MTLEESLTKRERQRGLQYQCTGCSKPFPAFALLVVGKSNLCLSCYRESLRAPTPEPEDSWNSELGKWLKAERKLVLDRHSWTIRRDSPLTKDCQDSWMKWFQSWNRMTVDFTPSEWVSRETPGYAYNDVDEIAITANLAKERK